jgi:hypothetical protein
LPGSNAVDAAKGVGKPMEQAKKRFPQDVQYVVSLDTTESVTEGIRDIVITILIAISLVTGSSWFTAPVTYANSRSHFLFLMPIAYLTLAAGIPVF